MDVGPTRASERAAQRPHRRTDGRTDRQPGKTEQLEDEDNSFVRSLGVKIQAVRQRKGIKSRAVPFSAIASQGRARTGSTCARPTGCQAIENSLLNFEAIRRSAFLPKQIRGKRPAGGLARVFNKLMIDPVTNSLLEAAAAAMSAEMLTDRQTDRQTGDRERSRGRPGDFFPSPVPSSSLTSRLISQPRRLMDMSHSNLDPPSDGWMDHELKYFRRSRVNSKHF